jgi:hypothetical protein
MRTQLSQTSPGWRTVMRLEGLFSSNIVTAGVSSDPTNVATFSSVNDRSSDPGPSRSSPGAEKSAESGSFSHTTSVPAPTQAEHPGLRLRPKEEVGFVSVRPLLYRYLPCVASSKAKCVAPHHPRIDHNAYYEGCHQRAGYFNYLNPYLLADPFCQGKKRRGRDISGWPGNVVEDMRKSWLHRVMVLLLCGDPDVLNLFQGWHEADENTAENRGAREPSTNRSGMNSTVSIRHFTPAFSPDHHRTAPIYLRAVLLRFRYRSRHESGSDWFEEKFERVHVPPLNLTSRNQSDWFVLPEVAQFESDWWRQQAIESTL